MIFEEIMLFLLKIEGIQIKSNHPQTSHELTQVTQTISSFKPVRINNNY